MEYTHHTTKSDMIVLMGKDPWTFISILGLTMFTVIDWISTAINPVIATVTGLLGAVLLGLGVIHKILIIRRELRQDAKSKP
jgi:hypothetical protein